MRMPVPLPVQLLQEIPVPPGQLLTRLVNRLWAMPPIAVGTTASWVDRPSLMMPMGLMARMPVSTDQRQAGRGLELIAVIVRWMEGTRTLHHTV